MCHEGPRETLKSDTDPPQRGKATTFIKVTVPTAVPVLVRDSALHRPAQETPPSVVLLGGRPSAHQCLLPASHLLRMRVRNQTLCYHC